MRVLLVALAVVLAGCPVFAPQPSPAGGQATPSGEYPPGVTESGVTDSTALASAHTDVVENASYTLVSNRTIRYTNGTLASQLFVRVRLAADRSFHASAATGGPSGPLFLGNPPASGEYWSNGTVYVRALTRDGQTTYNQFTPPDSFVGTWRYWRSTVPFGGQDGHAMETFESVFRDVPTDVVETRDVPTVLEGNGATSDSFLRMGPGPVGNVSLHAEVAESGLVRQFDLSYVTFLGNRSVRVDWSIRYRNVGNTSVDPPSWLQRALNDSQNSRGQSTVATPVEPTAGASRSPGQSVTVISALQSASADRTKATSQDLSSDSATVRSTPS